MIAISYGIGKGILYGVYDLLTLAKIVFLQRLSVLVQSKIHLLLLLLLFDVIKWCHNLTIICFLHQEPLGLLLLFSHYNILQSEKLIDFNEF